MQNRGGKHERRAWRRLVLLRTVFRKGDFPSVKIVIENNRNGEPAVRRQRRANVVAMGIVMPTGFSVVSRNQITLYSRNDELERFLDFGTDPPTDTVAYGGHEARVGEHHVASALPGLVETFDRLAVDIDKVAGLSAAVAIEDVDEMAAKFGFENVGQNE